MIIIFYITYDVLIHILFSNKLSTTTKVWNNVSYYLTKKIRNLYDVLMSGVINLTFLFLKRTENNECYFYRHTFHIKHIFSAILERIIYSLKTKYRKIKAVWSFKINVAIFVLENLTTNNVFRAKLVCLPRRRYICLSS